MAEKIEDLTIAYTDEATGRELVKELKKEVLTRGAWTTILYLYQERTRKNDEWSAPRARIERYQKRNGVFRSQSRFKISSAKQARQVVGILTSWFPEEG